MADNQMKQTRYKPLGPSPEDSPVPTWALVEETSGFPGCLSSSLPVNLNVSVSHLSKSPFAAISCFHKLVFPTSAQIDRAQIHFATPLQTLALCPPF